MAEDVKVAATKVSIAWLGALAGWGLADWAALMALIASFLAAIYTALQMWVLVRDKLMKK